VAKIKRYKYFSEKWPFHLTPGFATETLQSLGILRNIVRQEFERYEAPQLSVFGLVDHTHAATAQLLDDAIVRDGLADQMKRTFTLGPQS